METLTIQTQTGELFFPLIEAVSPISCSVRGQSRIITYLVSDIDRAHILTFNIFGSVAEFVGKSTQRTAA
jgi:hypothetical protein